MSLSFTSGLTYNTLPTTKFMRMSSHLSSRSTTSRAAQIGAQFSSSLLAWGLGAACLLQAWSGGLARQAK